MIRYLSLCSGIEAFSCAVHDMPEFVPVAFSEIEPFPCRVLQHHYPDVPNLGDMTKIDGRKYAGAVDLVVGGTPCQDFSVAGRRKGLDGERSGLALKFVELVASIRPKWLLWENVPGAFSTNGGRDFATFTAALAECGYHLCWRVLDAQYFGVPQRRRRIFLVGHFADWRAAAAVLFERKSLRGNTSQSKKKGQGSTKSTANCTGIGFRMQSFGEYEADDKASALKQRDWKDATDLILPKIVGCLDAGISRRTNNQIAANGHLIPTQRAHEHGYQPLVNGVRRLTPMEAERLQGFPDNYTNIPGASDTPRYKALGNSMAVPCMRWIAQRMLKVDQQISG